MARTLPHDELLANHTDIVGSADSTYIVRSMRNSIDFEYERQLALVNRAINPAMQTVFLSSPSELQLVSSSLIRELVTLKGWRPFVRDKVPTVVFDELDKRF